MRPLLIVISDEQKYPESFQRLAQLCPKARPGALMVLLRDRGMDVRARLRAGEMLREATRRSGQYLVVSDRVDLTLLLDADGVHLPVDGLLPTQAARLLARARPGASSWISRAGHGLFQMEREERRKLSAVFFSPVAAPRKGRSPLGLDGLRHEVDRLSQLDPGSERPLVYALGGIEGASAPGCLGARADGVAVIGAAHDPPKAQLLIEALGIAS